MINNQFIFDDLFNCIKKFEKRIVEFPDSGNQNKHNLYRETDRNDKFTVIINRKGHLNLDNLTFQLMSKTYGTMVRLDWNGATHDDVPTPHIHIFDDDHDNGRMAIPLDQSLDAFVQELFDSFTYFLDYNNIEWEGVSIAVI